MTTPETPVPAPQQGGSYVRDPITGELTRQEWTSVEPAADTPPTEQPTQPE